MHHQFGCACPELLITSASTIIYVMPGFGGYMKNSITINVCRLIPPLGQDARVVIRVGAGKGPIALIEVKGLCLPSVLLMSRD